MNACGSFILGVKLKGAYCLNNNLEVDFAQRVLELILSFYYRYFVAPGEWSVVQRVVCARQAVRRVWRYVSRVPK